MELAAAYPPWLTDIMSMSRDTLGLGMLRADPHAWRLDSAAQLAAVRDALVDGVTTAKALRQRFPDLAPQQIAQELGVPIERSNDDPMVGSLWRFAEYRQHPARILIYCNGLAPLERLLVGALSDRILGQATAEDVFVAHELFHHAESIRPEPSIAWHHRPTLFRIGCWHWRTGIAALSEIAAGAFAQSLLELPCHPRVLDLAALDIIRRKVGAGPTAEGLNVPSGPPSEQRAQAFDLVRAPGLESGSEPLIDSRRRPSHC